MNQSPILENPLYSLEIYKTGFTERQVLAISEKIRYYSRKHDCAWFLVSSTTQSRNAQIVTEKNGHAGRPAKKVFGEKIPRHIHAAVTGKSGHLCATEIKEALRRQEISSRISSKGIDSHAVNFVYYAMRQGDFYRSSKNFFDLF